MILYTQYFCKVFFLCTLPKSIVYNIKERPFMIQQSVILAIALIITLHTISSVRWPLIVGIILISNWGYQSIQQNNEMQRKLHSIILQQSESELNKKYPKITLLESSLQLGKDTVTTVQKILTTLGSDLELLPVKNEVDQ
jgi:hypothetical protein